MCDKNLYPEYNEKLFLKTPEFNIKKKTTDQSYL